MALPFLRGGGMTKLMRETGEKYQYLLGSGGMAVVFNKP